MQKYSSKYTSQNFKKKNKAYYYLPQNTKIVFDYGCGRYNNNKIYCETNNIKWIGYDPYWKPVKDNRYSLSYVKKHTQKIDCIVCSNVLNVIDSLEEIISIIEDIYSFSNLNTTIIFSLYKGNGSGIGKITKNDCWQRNEKIVVWIPRLENYFYIERIVGDIVICKKNLL